MKEKVLILLALLLLILPVTTLADSQDMKIQYLIDNDFVEGRTVGDYGVVDYALDKTMTRAETAKLLVHLLELEDLAKNLKGAMQTFNDVDKDHWANGYISVAATKNEEVANGRPLIIGYPDGKFLPEKDISYDELVVILVRLTKLDLTTEMEEEAIYPATYLMWADELGLLEDVDVEKFTSSILRKDAFTLIYNALNILEKTEKNEVDFSDDLAIVSHYQMGELVLNGDETYYLTKDTLFTDGTMTRDIFENTIQPGSLVRYIADIENNITHIIELGNPRDLGIPGRWFNISENLISAKEDTYIVNGSTESYEIKVGNITAEIDEETRIFAADKSKNALTEVSAVAELFEKYNPNRRAIKDVYMGYDDLGNDIYVAKVIVFNNVEKFQGKEEVRRIVDPVNSNLIFTAESMIEHYVKAFSLEDVEVFPNDYSLDYHDVVMIQFESYDEPKLKNPPIKLIDRSVDNIYKVVELEERYIVIEDEFGNIFPAKMGETAIFRRDELEVGSNIQIVLMPPDFILQAIGEETLMGMMSSGLDIRTLLDSLDLETLMGIFGQIESLSDFTFSASVISVVDEDPRGKLSIGVRTATETGYIDKIAGNTATIVDIENGVKTNYRSYKIAATDLEMAYGAFQQGRQIVFDKVERFGNTEYIYNIDFYFTLEELADTPMDNWMLRSLKAGVTRSWTLEKVNRAYTEFYEILGSETPYPVILRNRRVFELARASYNAANTALGGPGKVTVPSEYYQYFQ